ncbi:MAG: phosphopentomutase [Eubacteriales bacterium]
MMDSTSGNGGQTGVRKRVFLIVLDSFGIGRQPDANAFGDEGSNTLAAVASSSALFAPNLTKLGLFSIDGVKEDVIASRAGLSDRGDFNLFSLPQDDYVPIGAYGRLEEKSIGKDTTIGHWEIAGILSENPLPVYPHGFPPEVIAAFEAATGRKTICNMPYSGTDVIRDYGSEHVSTGALIVYTSADSVFQIAAHEGVVPIEELYRYCEIARGILTGRHAVGRVIARPFEGVYPDFKRTPRRHDFSLLPPRKTLLDLLVENRKDMIAVGKINDIFAGRGVTRFLRTSGNADGVEKTKVILKEPFEGLCFVNLVDFDMMYGHRNDIDGYAAAISAFDKAIPDILQLMQPLDILMITADHGCDPSTPSTDHSRECVPLLVCGETVKKGVNLHTRQTFSDIAATIAEYMDIPADNNEPISGTSFLSLVL